MFSPWGFSMPTTEDSEGNPIPAQAPQTRAPYSKPVPEKTAVTKWETHIDKDIVESIIHESNRLELKWLEEVLASLKIRNPKTGRYLKSERYVNQIRRIRKDGTSRERTSPSGTPEEVPSDWEQE